MIESMRQQVDFLKENPNREYSIADIRTFRLFPWAKDYRTIGKMIKRDFFGENILHARIESLESVDGENKSRQTRYYIKGKFIINFIEIYGPYLMGTTRKRKWKPKQEKS